MKLPTKILVYVFSLAGILMPLCGSAQNVAMQKAFVDAPQQVLPLLKPSVKLDMLDYYNSGLSTGSQNVYGGQSRVTSISPTDMHIALTAASQCQLALLSCGGDTLNMVIYTVLSPAADSQLTIYPSNWRSAVTQRYFAKPALSDWLTPQGKKNVEAVESLVPFLLVGYMFDPATYTLTLTNNTGEFLSKETYREVEQYLKPSIKYRWESGKFKPIK